MMAKPRRERPDIKKPVPPLPVSVDVDVEALIAQALAFKRRYRREHDFAYARPSSSLGQIGTRGPGDPTHSLVANRERQEAKACLFEAAVGLESSLSAALADLRAAHEHLDDIHRRGDATISAPYKNHVKISDYERKQSKEMQGKRHRKGWD